MPNVDTPRGFTPVRNADGSPYSGHGRRYYKDSTAGIIGVGDAVVRVVNSSDPQGGPEIVKHTVGSFVTGVVVAVDPVISNLAQNGYLAAADSGYVYVEDNPNVVFEVQEAGVGTALAITDIGKHIDSITAANASTLRGRSVDCIDNNAKATDNTWVIVGLSQKPDNEVGAYAKWLVKPNLHTEVNAGATNIREI